MDTINSDKSNENQDAPADESADAPVTSQAEETTEAPAAAQHDAGTADFDDTETDEDEQAAEAELAALHTSRAASNVGVLPGAAALVGLGLALASVTGTWLGTLMEQREQLIGQISSSSAPAAKQLTDQFGTPWHTTALFNGLFGLVAVLVAIGVLISQSSAMKPPAAVWIRAVTWAALVLGVIGLIIAGVMYLDIFTHLPSVPATPTAPSGGSAG